MVEMSPEGRAVQAQIAKARNVFESMSQNSVVHLLEAMRRATLGAADRQEPDDIDMSLFEQSLSPETHQA